MSELDKLKDIKPTLPTNFLADNLSAILITLVVLIALVVAAFFLFKRKKRRKKSKAELAKEALLNIDFNNTKESVYSFSENGYILLKDKPELLEKFENILSSLEKYKYKKEVPPLSKEDRAKIKEFIKEIV